MSAVAPHRSMLRHTRFIARQSTRRHASTTEAAKNTAANTAAKTKETASNVQTKASQGLSRVTTSASSGLSRASQGISTAISRIGGRTGRLISFVECELNFSCDQLATLATPLFCKSVFEDDVRSWLEKCCSRVYLSRTQWQSQTRLGPSKLCWSRANPFARSTYTTYHILFESWP